MTTPLSNLRVLVIDDHAVIRKTLKVVLGGLGITDVQDAESVDSAEEHLKNDPLYDVIFCDLNLPGRDGIEFLRNMPGLSPRTAIIIFSGEDERVLGSVAAMGRARGLNILAALTKPPIAKKVAEALAPIDEMPARRPASSAIELSADELDALLKSGLSVRFQPKVRAGDGELVGVEAFVRGKNAQRGEIPAGAIVRAATRHNRAGELGRFVLEESMAAAWRLHAGGLKVAIAINLDAAALRQQLPDAIADLARQHNVPLASIAIEVDEGQLLDDYANALEVMTRLRIKRCQLCLDGFGSGGVGLGNLRDLPITELKLSRVQVTGCDTRAASRSMIQATVGIAKAFGMTTTAVGVETEGEWKAARELGVDAIQGFAVSKPHTESMLTDWSAEWVLRAR